jgi:hypothetical protein
MTRLFTFPPAPKENGFGICGWWMAALLEQDESVYCASGYGETEQSAIAHLSYGVMLNDSIDLTQIPTTVPVLARLIERVDCLTKNVEIIRRDYDLVNNDEHKQLLADSVHNLNKAQAILSKLRENKQ